MTIIVSAFPCLGKTTLTSQNKERYFDMEIYESRATKGMSERNSERYFKNSAKNIKLIYDSGIYDVIFITDDDRLLFPLRKLGLDIIHVLPNPFNSKHFEEYKERVIARSGYAWYKRVLESDMENLSSKISKLSSTKEEVYFVEPGKYIEHLVPNIMREPIFENSDVHWR